MPVMGDQRRQANNSPLIYSASSGVMCRPADPAAAAAVRGDVTNSCWC